MSFPQSCSRTACRGRGWYRYLKNNQHCTRASIKQPREYKPDYKHNKHNTEPNIRLLCLLSVVAMFSGCRASIGLDRTVGEEVTGLGMLRKLRRKAIGQSQRMTRSARLVGKSPLKLKLLPAFLPSSRKAANHEAGGKGIAELQILLRRCSTNRLSIPTHPRLRLLLSYHPIPVTG